MITSDGRVGRFVIATPTKCGTTTLEEMCRRHRGGRAQPGLDSFRIMDWENPRRQHRMAPPPGWMDADRFLMVRNPYMRYMSMYEYLRAPHNYSKFGAREVQGREWRGISLGRAGTASPPMRFDQFLYWVAEQRVLFGTGRWVKRRGDLDSGFAYRSPWVWLDSLTDSLALLRAAGGGRTVEVLRLEQLWEDVELLKDRYQLRTLSVKRSIHANKTLTYPGGIGIAGLAYWSGIRCARRVFSREEGFRPAGVISSVGCECAACAVGVAEESAALGYVGSVGSDVGGFSRKWGCIAQFVGIGENSPTT